MNDYLNAQEWRYATKSFDENKKLSNESLEQLKRAVQLSASSYGLQAYQVLVIENEAIREKLRAASWGQRQITEASQVFVFCIPTALNDSNVDAYMQQIAAIRELPVEALAEFSAYLKGAIAPMSSEQKSIWLAKQTYIALGSLLNACAVMQIDACPMEGFDASEYDAILGLKERNLKSVVVAAVGYRSPADKNAENKKVRKPLEDLFVTI